MTESGRSSGSRRSCHDYAGRSLESRAGWSFRLRRQVCRSATSGDSASRYSIRGAGPTFRGLAAPSSHSSVLLNAPRVAGLFSSFTANDPQLAVDIDREKARSLGLPISEITNAMQIYLGSAYVNDFDFNNRAYRVYVQADKHFRADPKALGQYYARTNSGEM